MWADFRVDAARHAVMSAVKALDESGARVVNEAEARDLYDYGAAATAGNGSATIASARSVPLSSSGFLTCAPAADRIAPATTQEAMMPSRRGSATAATSASDNSAPLLRTMLRTMVRPAAENITGSIVEPF